MTNNVEPDDNQGTSDISWPPAVAGDKTILCPADATPIQSPHSNKKKHWLILRDYLLGFITPLLMGSWGSRYMYEHGGQIQIPLPGASPLKPVLEVLFGWFNVFGFWPWLLIGAILYRKHTYFARGIVFSFVVSVTVLISMLREAMH